VIVHPVTTITDQRLTFGQLLDVIAKNIRLGLALWTTQGWRVTDMVKRLRLRIGLDLVLGLAE